MRILVVTAVPAERDAILAHGPLAGVDVLAAGVGPASAAAGTAAALARAALARSAYDVVVSAGIGGGFPGVAALGSLVVAGRIVAADLGAETPDGFLGIDELGFGPGAFDVNPDLVARIADAARTVPLDVVVGPVLTVSTVTGSAARATELTKRHPGAAAEGMEGFGVAVAAVGAGVPVCELRAVSNPVGPRDREAWRVPDALRVLGTAGAVILPALREERA